MILYHVFRETIIVIISFLPHFLWVQYEKICRRTRRSCPSLRGGFQNYSQAGARSDEFVDPLELANPVGRQELLRSATIHLLSSSLGEPSVASDCLKNFPRMYCDFRTWNFCLPESRRKGEAVHRRTILDGVVAEFLGEIPEGKRIQDEVKRETPTSKCKCLVGFRFAIKHNSFAE